MFELSMRKNGESCFMAGRIAGNQTADRHPRDAYPTQPAWTRVLLDRVQLRGGVWEPAAGDGAMSRIIETAGYEVRSTDIVDGVDFLTCTDRAGTIITNPPYKDLDEFVSHGLQQADHMLCLLVGWHFLAGGARRADGTWIPHPPTRIIVIAERMRVNGSPSQFNHAWVIWDKSAQGPTTLEWAHA